MHWLLAITNACNGLKYVTRFSCDIFGFYVACIYLQKGIQVLTRQWASAGETSAYLAIMVALLVLMAAWIVGELGNSNLFQRYVRKFLEDYGTPLVIVFFTGFVHFGHMRDVDVAVLPTSKSFFPTLDRPWLVHFWNIDVGDIFLAIPFALLLTILFYFDHNGRYIPTKSIFCTQTNIHKFHLLLLKAPSSPCGSLLGSTGIFGSSVLPPLLLVFLESRSPMGSSHRHPSIPLLSV